MVLTMFKSCLFSLALGGQDKRFLELHNLYDRRFGTYGEITFSFVEFILKDTGMLFRLDGCSRLSLLSDNSPALDAAIPVCREHLYWPDSSGSLIRRDDEPPSSVLSSSTSPTTTPRGGLGRKMDTMIGLVVALIIIVIIALAALFAMRLRLQEVSRRLNQDSEKGRSDTNLNASTTAFSAPDPADQKTRSREKIETLPEDRYLKQSTVSDPTSSFSTHVDLGRRNDAPEQNRVIRADTTASAPDRSRPHSKPPAPPPKEPVPEVPRFPAPLVTRSPRNGDMATSVTNSPIRSPVQSRGQTRPQRSYPSIREVSPQSVRRTGRNIPESPRPTHLHNQSNSDSSMTSHESRRLKVQLLSGYPPPSSPLPLPESSPNDLLFKSTLVENGRSVQSNQNPNHAERRQRLDANTQPRTRLADSRVLMQSIRQSDTNSDPEITSPRLTVPSTRITHEHAKSAKDIQQGNESQSQPQTRPLRVSKSNSDLEKAVPASDIRWGVVTQPLNIRERNALRQGVGRIGPSKRDVQPQDKTYSSRIEPRISLKIPPDPPDWLTPSIDDMPLPNAAEARNEVAPAMRHNASLRLTREDRPDKRTASIRKSNTRLALSQPPNYEQAVAPPRQNLPFERPVIAPLTPHKRPLPKIPS